MGVDEPRERGIEVGRSDLPRLDDLPVSENGYDRERVHEAFEAFHRHALQLETALRVLESMNAFSRHAVELSEQLRELRAASWGPKDLPPPERHDAYADPAPIRRRPAAVRRTHVDSVVLPIAPSAPRRAPVVRLALEAAFIVTVAVACAVGGLGAVQIALVMALAWALVVLIEFAAARQRVFEFVPSAGSVPSRPSEPAPSADDDFDTSWDSDVFDAPGVARDESSESRTMVVSSPEAAREPVELPPVAEPEAEPVEAVLPPPIEEPVDEHTEDDRDVAELDAAAEPVLPPPIDEPLDEHTEDEPDPSDLDASAEPVLPPPIDEPLDEHTEDEPDPSDLDASAEPVLPAPTDDAVDEHVDALVTADDMPEPVQEAVAESAAEIAEPQRDDLEAVAPTEPPAATPATPRALAPLEPRAPRRRFWQRRSETEIDAETGEPDDQPPAEDSTDSWDAASGLPAADDRANEDATDGDIARELVDAAPTSTNGASQHQAAPLRHPPRRRVRSRRRRR